MINIVDSHNKVLSAWANYRKTLIQPPRLITLDHHTDTSSPFRRLIANTHGKGLSDVEFNRIQSLHLKDIQYSDPNSVETGVSKLNNDEHIIAAIKSNIISSACVIAHNAANTDLQTYKEHRVICYGVDDIHPEDGPPKLDYDGVLESSFLEQALIAFENILSQTTESSLLSDPYILDVDLDYFNTFKSVSPRNADKFKALAENAGLITIATEPEYVQSCAIDIGLTSEYLLEKLSELLPPCTKLISSI